MLLFGDVNMRPCSSGGVGKIHEKLAIITSHFDEEWNYVKGMLFNERLIPRFKQIDSPSTYLYYEFLEKRYQKDPVIVEDSEDLIPVLSELLKQFEINSISSMLLPFRELFEQKTLQQVKQKTSEQLERCKQQDSNEYQEEAQKDEDRNIKREYYLKNIEDVKDRMERRLNIGEATLELQRKMKVVRMQKSRNQNIGNEIVRIRKMNQKEPTPENLYRGLNELPLIDDAPTDSEEPSELSTLGSEYENLLKEDERRMNDDRTSDELSEIELYSPKSMVERLRKEKGFVPEEL
jgi:hypothetical protein